MTPPKTPLFAWQDRDHAARSMYALSLYAPPLLRGRALRLLSSFKSAVLVDEMVALVMDDSREGSDRRAAIETLAAVPTGNLYLPGLETALGPFWDDLKPHNFVILAVQHPRNIEWVFSVLARQNKPDFLSDLAETSHDWGKSAAFNALVEPYREELMAAHPSIDLNRESGAFYFNFKADDLAATYTASALLSPLYEYYLSALNGDESGFEALSYRAIWSESLLEHAGATRLVGLLASLYDALYPLMEVVQNITSADDSYQAYNESGVHFMPLQCEAGGALTTIVTPAVWEGLVNAYFGYTHPDFDHFFCRWIADLTDGLSAAQ